MGKVGELDRAWKRMRYDPWDRDITVVPPSAEAMLELQASAADIDDNHKARAAWFARMLATCVNEPEATAEEWLHEATLNTLVDLGLKVMDAVGITVDEKKSDSETPS